jgi:hypothetical protein
MAMEMHGTPGCDMDRFIKERAGLFYDRQSRDHLSLSFYNQFFKQRVNISTCFNLCYREKNCVGE